MDVIICYVEDELGGFFIREEDESVLVNICKEGKYNICCKGTKEQVEKYVGHSIDDYVNCK